MAVSNLVEYFPWITAGYLTDIVASSQRIALYTMTGGAKDIKFIPPSQRVTFGDTGFTIDKGVHIYLAPGDKIRQV